MKLIEFPALPSGNYKKLLKIKIYKGKASKRRNLLEFVDKWSDQCHNTCNAENTCKKI